MHIPDAHNVYVGVNRMHAGMGFLSCRYVCFRSTSWWHSRWYAQNKHETSAASIPMWQTPMSTTLKQINACILLFDGFVIFYITHQKILGIQGCLALFMLVLAVLMITNDTSIVRCMIAHNVQLKKKISQMFESTNYNNMRRAFKIWCCAVSFPLKIQIHTISMRNKSVISINVTNCKYPISFE